MPNSIHDFEAFRSDLTHIKIGTIIPKPKSEEPFIIKGWGIRRGEKALIYFIPNHNNASRPYEKGITLSEWEKAFNRLLTKGEFSRDWFNKEMASCKDEGHDHVKVPLEIRVGLKNRENFSKYGDETMGRFLGKLSTGGYRKRSSSINHQWGYNRSGPVSGVF